MVTPAGSYEHLRVNWCKYKLKNRRVHIGWDDEQKVWGVRLYILIDRATRDIRLTEFALSDEAMSVFQLGLDKIKQRFPDALSFLPLRPPTLPIGWISPLVNNDNTKTGDEK